MGMVKEEIAAKLVYYRKLRGLTQGQLAQEIGVKNNSVSSWENAINAIDVDVLHNICKILNISIAEIYGKYALSDNEILTSDEIKLLDAYKKQPEMRFAVAKLLGTE